jgi:hypothetical protein
MANCVRRSEVENEIGVSDVVVDRISLLCG